MDYELFVFSIYKVEELTEKLVCMVKNILKRDVNCISRKDEYIFIGCETFGITIEIEDISDLDYIKESCRININLCISIQVSHKTFDEGIRELFQIIINLLKIVDGDILFLFNGEKQVLRRDNGVLTLNEDVEYIPYELIDIPYKKEKLLNL
ncbi:hypothetical protein [Clostridium felsineum]|uniref:Uncharacterized protein n=1 Tax=Clostridium felsineum TaxID=36839 RepID=A0A1S8MHT9_9CLOT|nr:hypothetical protein [Clostridium felsineum]URZ07173.1 hypothetical protein CLROS_025060 [Clostridium felsineum]URZ12202.1 hypothetical protein CROST_029190 [Clostridium felsineum]